MKRAYEKPVITKLVAGWMNKYGRGSSYARRVRKDVDGVPVDRLVGEHGSPLFIYSERALRRLHRHWHTAFSTRYPKVTFGWSYKTNYLPAICALQHQLGSVAEVVSAMEYEKARALGVPGNRIIFNGPHKTPAALERAVSEGARIQVDHLDELASLEEVARRLNRPVTVGLRLNLDAGIYPQWSRFGFNLENGQALDAIQRMKQGGRLNLNGLHAHLGTYITDASAYGRQVTKMVQFGYEVEKRFGFPFEVLDIGGGFPSHSRLKSAYLAPELSLPSADEYAEAITQALTSTLRPGDFPQLILETGRALVDDAGWLITTVQAAKRMADGTRAYVVDAGINLLFTSAWYKFTIELDRELGGLPEHSLIHGPLCMNIDVVDEGTLLPPLSSGMRLILSPVGAYNATQSMQFIEYRPASVLIGAEGQVDVIREAEDLSDITRRERLPPRLALEGGA